MKMVSTKGRYALRVMLDLAEHSDGSYIPMKDVAERQGVSLKYVEKILPVLARHDLIKGVHGKGGGYMLTRKPEDYRVGEILRLTEGDMAPVACLSCDAEKCEHAEECKTLPMWSKFYSIVTEYFDSITLKDLMDKNISPDVNL